jgi:tetratricopeptide (TPR) repeat protein
LVLVAMLLFSSLVGWLALQDFTSSTQLFREAKTAMAKGDWPLAEKLALRLASRPSQNAAGNLLAAEVATKLNRLQDAIEYYAKIPDDGSTESVQAQLATGDLLFSKLSDLSGAERAYRQILNHAPHEVGANYRLAYLLGLEGRSWEAVPHRLGLIRENRHEPIQLIALALAETAVENPHLIDEYKQARLENPAIWRARAWVHIRSEEWNLARPLLEQATKAEPDLLTSQAWLGKALLDGPDAGFLSWNKHLSPAADLHPEIWLARGLWAMNKSQPRAAVRCFWESVRLNPESTPANFHLGTVLAALGESKLANVFRHRARLLGDFTIVAKSFQMKNSADNAKSAARLADELELPWEAWGWLQILNQLAPGQREVVQKLETLRNQLDRLPGDLLTRSQSAVNPAHKIDLGSYPLPDWGTPGGLAKTQQSQDAANGCKVVFADQAAAAGVEFQFRNGSLPGSLGDFMYEMSGGGVGVLDFNNDGWPDLYLTQGSDWPRRPDQNEFLDKLYRNLGNGRFEEVSAQAQIFENEFSQGPAVGDFDQDGFPDLYVSNIGPNRMFHNNGDGTFTEITPQTGTAGDRWTISSAVADFNGDSLPDLYTVNYLSGEGLFDRPCGVKAGTNRSGCSPHEYLAAQDQLFLNLGDGRFQEQTAESGIVVPNGKGMGIIAADFNGSGKLSLFVGNDAVPNFFFVNETELPGAPIRFKEQAYGCGLAVDADGRAQACMGIAAGDANGDGLVDLFVTNFRAESNTLYLNQSHLAFIDDTRRSGLREPSFDLLGFGTQFLDGELDGRPDLVVANGHIANFSSTGVDYEMRPQYFHNSGDAQFKEVTGEPLGAYFKSKRLGRGLARWDWNRDGKEDFAVSQLAAAAALVTNHTPQTGHFLAVQLRGVKSERDAIGTQVTVTCGALSWTHQLMAGDGYQASNQRQLIFGVGAATQIDKVEVRWLNGDIQQCGPLETDREYLVIEGRPAPVTLVP